jgi:hypothetical protein
MKTPESNLHMKPRREILRACLRCGGFIALGGVASLLGWRGAHGKCVKNNPCGACPRFADCDLPKANEAKTKSQESSSNHG